MSRGLARGGGMCGARNDRIALIGPMGSGKSRVGKLLARRTGRAFVDMDVEIARAAGMTIPAIFATRGEGEFRRREAALLSRLARRRQVVIATGGGIVTLPLSRRLLKRSFDVYWLDVGAAEAWRRLGSAAGRPMLMGSGGRTPRQRLVELARERRPFYRSLGRRIVAGGKSATEVADRIARLHDGADDR